VKWYSSWYKSTDAGPWSDSWVRERSVVKLDQPFASSEENATLIHM
jgi:hypothetical protein